MRIRVKIMALVSLGLLLTNVAWAAPEAASGEVDNATIGRTPPRLSYLEGQVSFWRPGAEDWAQAQINTALAPGDQLIVNGEGNLEVQIGSQAFVRAGANAQVGLETREPDFLRFRIIDGQVAFDIRALAPGRTVEVDTPHAVVTIENEGYYRFGVAQAQTSFVTRRAGRATVLPADSDAVLVEPDEAVVIQGSGSAILAFQVVPELDGWDNWNYDRTDRLMEARSLRYLSPGTYGARDLDQYGAWRTLPAYGSVWVPAGVAPGWAPYSSGRWMYDPYYGWTWVDTAPWGWAPYHYGRWVYVNSYWCWAPGPIVRRAVYAPALVAFLGRPGLSVSVGIGGPPVGWVCLGWGEPLVPWWGRPGFIHRPWWGGWGGPRIVNDRIIHVRTVVKIDHIRHYRNTRVPHAISAVGRDDFGRGPIGRHRGDWANNGVWQPLHHAPQARRGEIGHAPPSRVGLRPGQNSFGPPVENSHLHDHRSAPVTRAVPSAGIRSVDRPDRPRIPRTRHYSSGADGPQKITRPSASQPAARYRDKQADATGQTIRHRPEKHRQVTAPTNRPKAILPDSGRDGSANGADLSERRKSFSGPSTRAPGVIRPTVVRPPVPSGHTAPAARRHFQSTVPFQPSTGHAGGGETNHRSFDASSRPAVRVPGRQAGGNVPVAPPRITRPHDPTDRSPSPSRIFRNSPGRPADVNDRAPVRGYFRESPQNKRGGRPEWGNPPRGNSGKGFGRRSNSVNR